MIYQYVKYILLFVSLTLLPVTSSARTPTETSSVQASPQRISAMIKTLASDQFEGRAPGTTGERRTIAWLISRFRALGLEPGGAQGKWTQDVPLLRTKLDMEIPLTLTGPNGDRKLIQGQDIYLSTQRDSDRAKLANVPLVFVGYGINAPEKGWDDFKGVDLAGKVAVFLVNDPDFDSGSNSPISGLFGGKAMTYYGRWSYKFEEAVRRGAVAALIVHDTSAAGYGWNTIVSPQAENFDLTREDSTANRLAVQGWLSSNAAKQIFDSIGLDLSALVKAAGDRRFKPVPLNGLALNADVPVTREHILSQNVLARIPGKKRADEVITFGAHWDAFGIGTTPDSQGRTVRAGALDDGSGVAGLLEIARLFKRGKRPDRTVLFGLWTAEERGLLGSDAFMASGLYPAHKIVANITLDTLQPTGLARDFVLIGQGQNSLEDDLARAAQIQNRSITPDSRPERGLFYRADHFSFARHGVPAVIFMALGGGVDLVKGGRAKGELWVSDFTANCYHQPCDDWRADWDLRGAAQDVDLAYAIGRGLADSDQWPTWRPGSEFKTIRDASTKN